LVACRYEIEQREEKMIEVEVVRRCLGRAAAKVIMNLQIADL
jgi:hypothetical protein